MTPAFLLAIALAAPRAEPQATFAHEAGWIVLTLTHGEQPVGDALIQVYDEAGAMFASGETGANGRGQFPLPRGDSFLVEFKIGDRTADPIRITSTPNGPFPGEVLLSFGLAPCCRVPSGGWAAPEATPGTNWLWPTGLAGLAVFGSAALVLLFLGPRARNS